MSERRCWRKTAPSKNNPDIPTFVKGEKLKLSYYLHINFEVNKIFQELHSKLVFERFVLKQKRKEKHEMAPNGSSAVIQVSKTLEMLNWFEKNIIYTLF